MIRFALTCDRGHGFEAWFSSGSAFEAQAEACAVVCPDCGSVHVRKAPMAPAVLRGKATASAGHEPAKRGKTYALLKGLRDHLKANAEDVGSAFPEEARKIHYGEAEARSIYGEASADDAEALHEEGIPAMPLPVLPDDHN